MYFWLIQFVHTEKVRFLSEIARFQDSLFIINYLLFFFPVGTSLLLIDLLLVIISIFSNQFHPSFSQLNSFMSLTSLQRIFDKCFSCLLVKSPWKHVLIPTSRRLSVFSWLLFAGKIQINLHTWNIPLFQKYSAFVPVSNVMTATPCTI